MERPSRSTRGLEELKKSVSPQRLDFLKSDLRLVSLKKDRIADWPTTVVQLCLDPALNLLSGPLAGG